MLSSFPGIDIANDGTGKNVHSVIRKGAIRITCSFRARGYHPRFPRASKAARPGGCCSLSVIAQNSTIDKVSPLHTDTQSPLPQEKIKSSNCLYYFQTLATKHRCSLLRIKGRGKGRRDRISLILLWIIEPHCLEWPLSLKKKRIFRLNRKVNESLRRPILLVGLLPSTLPPPNNSKRGVCETTHKKSELCFCLKSWAFPIFRNL